MPARVQVPLVVRVNIRSHDGTNIHSHPTQARLGWQPRFWHSWRAGGMTWFEADPSRCSMPRCRHRGIEGRKSLRLEGPTHPGATDAETRGFSVFRGLCLDSRSFASHIFLHGCRYALSLSAALALRAIAILPAGETVRFPVAAEASSGVTPAPRPARTPGRVVTTAPSMHWRGELRGF
jgi:hypothetical protein